MDINDIKNQVSEKVKNNYKPNSPKKKIMLGVIVVLLGALGLEMSNNDWDLGKIIDGSSLSESKVKRDIDGNVVTDGSGKYTDEYNCADFKTQPQAQNFFIKSGGPNEDVNRLDGNDDGVACQDLPKN